MPSSGVWLQKLQVCTKARVTGVTGRGKGESWDEAPDFGRNVGQFAPQDVVQDGFRGQCGDDARIWTPVGTCALDRTILALENEQMVPCVELELVESTLGTRQFDVQPPIATGVEHGQLDVTVRVGWERQTDGDAADDLC